VPHYRRLYGRGAYVSKDYRRWLAARVAPLVRRHGLEPPPVGRGSQRVQSDGPGDLLTGVPGDPGASFPAGSLPEPTLPALEQQLTLL
jgi:hypothetical protein